MTKRVFDEGISIIISVFGDAFARGFRLERIKEICTDRVSDEGFLEICRRMCDTFRQFPIPSDFEKAVIDWRKNFLSENGYAYGISKNRNFDEKTSIASCSRCNDLGLILIKHHIDDAFESFMRCDCHAGAFNGLLAPQWDSQLSGAYKISPLPIEWFKAVDIKQNSPDSKIYRSLNEKMEIFKKKKEQAEQHWKSIGYK